MLGIFTSTLAKRWWQTSVRKRGISQLSILDAEWEGALQKKGLERLTPIQELALPLLQGKNANECAVLLAETGSGKTWSYLIPLLKLLKDAPDASKVKYLVLVPTRDLAAQVVAAANELAETLGMSRKLESTTSFHTFGKSGVLIASTPTAFKNQFRRGENLAVQVSTLSHIVVDEADMLLQGLYQKSTVEVLYAAKKLNKPVIFCAATLPELRPSSLSKRRQQPRGFIERHFPNARWLVTAKAHSLESQRVEHDIKRAKPAQSSEFMRSLSLLLKEDSSDAKKRAARLCTRWYTQTREKMFLQALVKIFGPCQNSTGRKRCLVFVKDDVTAERVAALTRLLMKKLESADSLSQRGLFIDAVHGKKPCGERAKAIDGFCSLSDESLGILVATDLLSRGHDFQGVAVDAVINYDFPTDMMTYIHRVGRVNRGKSRFSGKSSGAPSTETSLKSSPVVVSFVPFSATPATDPVNVLADAIDSVYAVKSAESQSKLFSNKRSLKKKLKKQQQQKMEDQL